LWKIINTSVAEPHHFYAAPASGKNFDAAPAAPASTLLYSKAKFFLNPSSSEPEPHRVMAPAPTKRCGSLRLRNTDKYRYLGWCVWFAWSGWMADVR
jgi:hypothetical protein